MSIINELQAAITSYVTTDCLIEIVNFRITDAIGPRDFDVDTALNVGEIFQFQVTVYNNGSLDMKNVRVRVSARDYAEVALQKGSFSTYAYGHPFNLDAHQTYTTGYFRGKAKSVTNGEKEIVKAQIKSWDASLEHILKDRSGQGYDVCTLNKVIYPD